MSWRMEECKLKFAKYNTLQEYLLIKKDDILIKKTLQRKNLTYLVNGMDIEDMGSNIAL